MLNIYLTRHGQDLDNFHGILNGRRDKPLSYIGRRQAKEAATKLKNLVKFDFIYTSPLKRAYKTAKIISKNQGISTPIVMQNLIERDFGKMTGKSLGEIEVLCKLHIIKTNTCTYFLNPAGAETFPQLVVRAKKVLSFIQKNYKDGNILLVTHGDIGKMIYAVFYKIEWKKALKSLSFGNTDLLSLSVRTKPDKAKVIETVQFNF
ncbi:MAG: histidine phosphatase family protein [Patescibacteria group bacterium]